MEKWNLHKRIALNIINVVGYNKKSMVLGFMIATAFLSMWLSNTSTSIMMLPIGIAIISQVSLKNNILKLKYQLKNVASVRIYKYYRNCA